MRKRRRRWTACAYAPLVVLATCSPRLELSVKPGPGPQRPAFEIGEVGACFPTEPSTLDYIRVDRCEATTMHPDSAVWTMERSGSAPLPRRVVYGELPTGYISRTGPDSLAPGCYRAVASADGAEGYARFTVGGAAELGVHSLRAPRIARMHADLSLRVQSSPHPIR